jgi:FkbM family methyltransferase
MPTSWKKRLANLAMNRLGLQVCRTGAAWTLIEPEQLTRFLNHFRVDCVFDVGANVGQYATGLRAIGFQGLIISFEPNPRAAATLRHTAANDALWIVKEIALDADTRETSFNIMRESQFSSLLRPSHAGTACFPTSNSVVEEIALTTMTLRDLFPSLQRELRFLRPYLKMDTQGHDLAVTRGAGSCLREFVGLQSELSLTPLYAGAPSYSEALAYFCSEGFKPSALVPNNAGQFPDVHEIDCIMYNSRFANEPKAI